MSPTLPVGLLRKIIQDDQLRRYDLKEFSRTSRLFREIALPVLFRSISLRIGIDVNEKCIEDDESICTYFETDVEYEGYRVEKSLQVLRGMGKDKPGGKKFPFVHLVQELQINYLGEAAKHTRYVKLALKKLVNLRHFVWHGPSLPDDLASVLSRLDILLSFNLDGINDRTCRTLRTFKKIRSIETVADSKDFLFRHDYPTIDEDANIGIFLEVVDKNRTHLKRLSLYGYTLRRCFNRGPQLLGIADSLTHLAVCGAVDSPALWQFLRKASSLEFLTVLDTETLNFLPATPGSLPRLRYLKLGISRTIGITYTNVFRSVPDMEKISRKILKFVGMHKYLDGFDLSFYVVYGGDPDYIQTFRKPKGDLDVAYNAMWFDHIAKAICTLRNVRALGITLPAMKPEDVGLFLERILDRKKLKQTCTALRLGGLSNVPLEEVYSTEFHNCDFISLSTGRPEEHFYNSYDPLYYTPGITHLISLHHECERLQQFHLNGTMYNVDGVCEDDLQVIALFWDEERAARKRIESDFVSFEAYWLMRYRTIKEDYDSTFGEDHQSSL